MSSSMHSRLGRAVQLIIFNHMKANMTKVLYLLLASFACLFNGLYAQSPILERMDTVDVFENGFPLLFPFAGGLDQPQFSPMDLDGDAVADLLVFDRAGNKVLTFVNGGTPGTVDYQYAPEWQSSFPDTMQNFVLARDLDCDGLMDLVTSNAPGISVYRNTGSAGAPAFSIYRDTVFTDRGLGQAILAIPATDIPAIVDIDRDGDIDILTFDPAGNFVEWHKNNALENTGNCAAMEFILTDECWGNFQEGASDATITLGITCRRPSPAHRPKPNSSSVHAGSTLATFDEDGDGIYEMILGDLVTPDVTYLHNGGTLGNADMDSTYIGFPSYDTPIRIDKFVANFVFDVNNDGKDDLVAAPNEKNASANYQNSWYYQNFAAGAGAEFSLIDTRFLQRDMIDVGTLAFPTFFDYNNDGLLDLFVGNFNRKTSANSVVPGVALYENTGTATNPAFSLVTRDYEGLATVFGNPIYGLVPAFVDLDGDGDKDMMLGEDGGKLHYFENIAPTGQTADFVLSQSNYNGIDVGNFSTPTFADLDGDGDQDMVLGEYAGNLNFFENTGTPTAPVFGSVPDDNLWGNIDVLVACCTGYSAPFLFTNPATNKIDLVMGTERGHIWYYQDVGNQSSPFQRTTENFGQVREGNRTAIAGADLNQDGRWEWVIGNLRGGLSLFTETGLTAANGPELPAPIQITVHPNPSLGALHVTLPPTAGKRLRVTAMDLNGRVLLEQSKHVGDGNLTLQAEHLAPGAYLLRFELDGRYAGSAKWIRIQ